MPAAKLQKQEIIKWKHLEYKQTTNHLLQDDTDRKEKFSYYNIKTLAKTFFGFWLGK